MSMKRNEMPSAAESLDPRCPEMRQSINAECGSGWGAGEGAVWDEISISPSSGGVGNRFHSWTQYCVFHSSTVFEATSVQSGTSVALYSRWLVLV